MGTWDVGFFDNDMACDWENGIKKNRNMGYIEEALLPVINNKEETLAVDDANRAVAASEALARLLHSGSESNSYSKHIDKWAEEFSETVPDSLIDLAVEALNRVMASNSDLKQFWTIRGESTQWLKQLNSLKDRLTHKYEK